MQNPPTTDSLDDIFGSSPPPPSQSQTTATTTNNHPEPELSDIPSLRRQHVTSGYREGVTSSKNAHIQNGFDAGFPVGAQLGMRAGTILGILEGLIRGYDGQRNRSSGLGGSGGGGGGVVKKLPQRGTGAGADTVVQGEGNETLPSLSSSSPSSNEKRREPRSQMKEKLLGIYHDASKELSVQEVFAGSEPVSSGGSSGAENGANNGEEKREKKDTPENQLKQRADPVVSRWEKRAMVSQWEENMEALEEKDSEGNGKRAESVAQS